MFNQQDLPALQFAIWTLNLNFLTNIIIPDDCFSTVIKFFFSSNKLLYGSSMYKAEKSPVSLVQMGVEILLMQIYFSVGSQSILRQSETLWALSCSTEHHFRSCLNGLKDAFQPQHYSVRCLPLWACKGSSRCDPGFQEERGKDRGH